MQWERLNLISKRHNSLFVPLLRYLITLWIFLSAPIAYAGRSHMEYAAIEVTVTSGMMALAGASVALDLDDSGTWDEYLGEPRGLTDVDGIVVFDDVLSTENAGPRDNDWSSTHIMMKNIRGSVGAQDVNIDYVVPAGSGRATLAVYDMRGRRIVQTSGMSDLELTLPDALPSGTYFLRLSSHDVPAATARITSVGVRTRTIRANRVSNEEADAAGWYDDSSLVNKRERGKLNDQLHHINLIVDHQDYPVKVQAETIVAGLNEFVVNVLPGSVVVEPDGEGIIEVTDPDDPLYGARVVIPQGAVDQTTLVTLDFVESPPAPSAPYISSIIMAVDITVSPDDTLAVPAVVSLPIAEWELGDPYLPVPAYYDEIAASWRILEDAPLEIESGMISFQASHFSIYSAMELWLGTEIMDLLLQGTDGSTLLEELVDVIVQGTDCNTVSNLEAQLLAVEDSAHAELYAMTEGYLWCDYELLCGGTQGLEWIDEKIREKLILFGLEGLLHLGVAGSVLGGVMSLAATPCLVCILQDTTFNLEYWSTLASLIAAIHGQEICERWLEQNCSNPGGPDYTLVQVRTLELDGYLWDLVYVGDTAYIASGGIHVVDIGTPENATYIDTYGTGLGLMSLAVESNYLYAYGWGGSAGAELHVYDITAPHQLVHLGQMSAPRAPGAIDAESGVVYLAEMSQGLHIIDVSSPESPEIVGQLGGFEFASDIAANSDHVWVSEYVGKLVGVDVSEPTSPTRISSIPADSTSIVRVAEDIGMYGDRDNKVVFYDANQLASPIVYSSVNTEGWIYRGDHDGEKAVLYETEMGLVVVDLANPYEPEIDFRLSHADYIEGIAVRGDYAFVATRLGQFTVYRLSPDD